MADSANNDNTCSASKIADFFATEFYGRLKKDPSTLYELYHDSGHLVWVGNRPRMTGDQLNSPSIIRAEMKDKIRSAINIMDLGDCTTYVEVLECSKSARDFMFITAKGRMYIGEEENTGRCFVQSFVLIEIRPRWYFIRNDCLIFLDSELPFRKTIPAAPKNVISETITAEFNDQKPQDESDLDDNNLQEQANLNDTQCDEQDKETDQQVSGPKEDEGKDLSDTAFDVHACADPRDESQRKADSPTTTDTIDASSNCSNAPASTFVTDNAPANTIPQYSPLDPAKYVSSLSAKDIVNSISRSILQKYEVTSYAGKLMGGALKSGNKIKGYAIHVPADVANKAILHNDAVKKASAQKDLKSLKEVKNKRKIFVHSLPTNVPDDQIREAVLNQLRVHGGGYVIDIERARANGRHWGIIELDSEFSCATLLNNGLYLGGIEISIEKWKQINASQNPSYMQNSSKLNRNSNRPTGHNYYNIEAMLSTRKC